MYTVSSQNEKYLRDAFGSRRRDGAGVLVADHQSDTSASSSATGAARTRRNGTPGSA